GSSTAGAVAAAVLAKTDSDERANVVSPHCCPNSGVMVCDCNRNAAAYCRIISGVFAFPAGARRFAPANGVWRDRLRRAEHGLVLSLTRERFFHCAEQ